MCDKNLKDAVLDGLASMGNIAQFVSFAPGDSVSQRFCRIAGVEPNHRFPRAEEAVAALLERSPDRTVNVRSFRPEHPKGGPFLYGLSTVPEVLAALRGNASEGRYSIVNETVDVNDGGVSGVALGQAIEFAPHDTPKCVDKPGVCSLPRPVGLRMPQTVYGFEPQIDFGADVRVEFSIHPRRRGLWGEHTIIWELERIAQPVASPGITWPNNFSRTIGDKVFGLLVADALGLPVPRTTVVARAVAPFTFGRETGSGETWMRTSPQVRVPGKYPTKYGWCDPFQLLAEMDAEDAGERERVPIASVLAQEAVLPVYSGSLAPGANDEPYIEGVSGPGDAFMLGQTAPQTLPEAAVACVRQTYKRARRFLGPVGMEWVYDGDVAWVVQLHRDAASVHPDVVHPGEAKKHHRFDVRDGLEALRDLVARVRGRPEGVVLVGDVGITSHFGDILRSAKIPLRIELS